MKRFLQTPAMIVILNEDLTYRQIFMDGRALETDPNPSWMGYSVGHWDRDTLVVESVGFNDRTWLHDGYPHTERVAHDGTLSAHRFRPPGNRGDVPRSGGLLQGLDSPSPRAVCCRHGDARRRLQ